jgi:glycosyltransferase involved in cell wall biosynthesis
MNLTVTLRGKAKEIYLDGKWFPIGVPVSMELSRILRHRRSVIIELPDIEKLPYNKSLWKKNKTFGFTGDADVLSGYGNCTVNLVKNCSMAGYDVRWVGKNHNVPEMRTYANNELPVDMAMVWHEQPRGEWDNSPFSKNIALTPFETTRIPQSWVGRINKFDALLVPCKQNVTMMRDSGVRIPISVIHWGVDFKKFYPVERNNRNFTFGCMGALSERKGTDLLVKAFCLAFPAYQYPNVRLLCKSSHNMFKWGVKGDQRIIIQLNPVAHEELVENFIKKVDCFVFPSRGEGAGLPPIEMLATEMPVICSNHSGMADYMSSDYAYPLNDFKMVPAKDFSEKLYHENCGDWWEPSLEELVNTMRHVYLNQDEAKEKGKKGAQYVSANWSWEQGVKTFTDALDKYC